MAAFVNDRGETRGVSREEASRAVLAVAKAMVESQTDPDVRRMVEQMGADRTIELLAGVRVEIASGWEKNH